MSIQAFSWAIEQEEVKDPITQLVLLTLANYAGESGLHTYPSIGRLVKETRLSESTVRRHIAQLMEMGLLVRGNQSFVQHIQANHRPIVYDLVIPELKTNNKSRGVTVTPQTNLGVSENGSRGVTNRVQGCQSLTPNPKRSEENLKSGLEDFRQEWIKRFGKEPEIDPAKLAKPSRLKQ